MDLRYITFSLNGVLMVAMPLVLADFLNRRYRLGWRLFWIGAAGFVLSQVGHIPFNWILTRAFQVGALPTPPADWRPYFNPIVLGLSAGLFEELTRAGIFRWWATDARSWRKALMLGTGHGGTEAIIFGVLVLYTFFQMAVLRGADLSKVVPPAQVALAQQQLNAYWSQPLPITLLGALERFFTIPIQISLSVIVLQAFTRKGQGWLWVTLAILYHAVVDAVAVYYATLWGRTPGGVYAVEGLTGLFALISVAIIWYLRRSEPQEPEEVLPVSEVPSPLTAADMEPKEVEVNEDKLDSSRYV